MIDLERQCQRLGHILLIKFVLHLLELLAWIIKKSNQSDIMASDITWVGSWSQRNYELANFPKNCMKMKEIGSRKFPNTLIIFHNIHSGNRKNSINRLCDGIVTVKPWTDRDFPLLPRSVTVCV